MAPMPERVPPGRAGRLWLRARLVATKRSADLLDHKRQLMRSELTRLASTRDEAGLAWKNACSEAERWGLRATTLGGALGVSLTGGYQPAPGDTVGEAGPVMEDDRVPDQHHRQQEVGHDEGRVQPVPHGLSTQDHLGDQTKDQTEAEPAQVLAPGDPPRVQRTSPAPAPRAGAGRIAR